MFFSEYICPANMMKCGDETCANGYPCDGTENCVDGSDENDCTGTNTSFSKNLTIVH